MTKGDLHQRRSLRLAGFDYGREGAYFVTICTHDRPCLFGEIVNGEMRLNVAGQVAATCWLDIPAHFPHVRLDTYTIMPNHVHGIIWIDAHPVAVLPACIGIAITLENRWFHRARVQNWRHQMGPGQYGRSGCVATQLL